MIAHKSTLRLLLITLLAGFLAACAEPNDFPPAPTLTIPSAPIIQNQATTAAPDTTQPTDPIPATPSAEAEASPTAEPTFTPTPPATPAPTPATNPAVQAVTAANLPTSSRTLYFTADGAFKRWSATTGQVEVLLPPTTTADPAIPGAVRYFDITADGQRAIVTRLTAVDSRTEADEALGFDSTLTAEQYELFYLDLVSGQQWLIIPTVNNLRGLAIAPNGQNIALAATSTSGTAEPAILEEQPQSMFVLNAGGGSAPSAARAVGVCEVACQKPLWHIESNLLVWADQAALWLYNTAASQPEKLVDHVFAINEVSAYWPVAWANNGRYLLLTQIYFESLGTAVYDVPTRALISVPNSAYYITPYPPTISWMPDDRLLFAPNAGQPTVELWRIQLEAGTVAAEETLTVGSSGQGVAGLRYLADGRFAYALFSADTAAGTYLLTSLSQQPERVNAVPPLNPADPFTAPQVVWAADGSGAIVGTTTAVYYAPTNSPALYDVTAVLGTNASHFTWR